MPRPIGPLVAGALLLGAAVAGPAVVSPSPSSGTVSAPVLVGASRGTGAAGDVPAPLVVVAPRPWVPWGAARALPVRPGRRLRVDVALRPSHVAEMSRLLSDLYDPASTSFHHFLPRGAFAGRFGPPVDVVDRLRAFFARHGLATHVDGFALAVAGPARAVESAFHVRFVQDGPGPGAATAAAGPLLLPRAVAGDLAGVIGASPLPAVVPHLVVFPLVAGAARIPPSAPVPRAARAPRARRVSGAPRSGRPRVGAAATVPSGCAEAAAAASVEGGLTLDEAGAHYGVTPLLAAGDNGTGETVAVYELAASSTSDVGAGLACEGLSAAVTVVPVDGGGSAGGAGTTEANLDIEEVATQAPGASILAYEGPDTGQGEYDVWAAIVGEDRASVVSTSWGLCEAAFGGSVPAEATLFAEAAAQGQTIVAAAGDSGSEDCWPSGPDAVGVDFPASDPWVTGVGGTTIVGGAGSVGGDVVWNACAGATTPACAGADGHAGGGGASSLFAEPAWQEPVGVLPTSSAGCGAPSCRGVPDLAANAGTPEIIWDGGTLAAVGGTSAAAPLVAGLAADVADTCAEPLGALDPGLYGLAAAGGYGTGLVDVTAGSNDLTGSAGGLYAAGVGYDLASGLGVPIASGLACPGVTSVTPPVAPAGAVVTLAGTNLTHAAIDFGGASAPVVQATATSAQVIVPAGSGSLEVTASTPIGAGRSTAGFRYGTPAGTPGASPVGPTPARTLSALSTGGSPAAPAGVRAAVRGRVVALRWAAAPKGTASSFVLVVRGCERGAGCWQRRVVLAGSRRAVTLRLVPGRYRLSLTAVVAGGRSRAVIRSVRVA